MVIMSNWAILCYVRSIWRWNINKINRINSFGIILPMVAILIDFRKKKDQKQYLVAYCQVPPWYEGVFEQCKMFRHIELRLFSLNSTFKVPGAKNYFNIWTEASVSCKRSIYLYESCNIMLLSIFCEGIFPFCYFTLSHDVMVMHNSHTLPHLVSHFDEWL